MNTEQAEQGSVELAWFKSSYSGSDGGNCVEVAAGSGVVRMRDSKDVELGSFAIARGAWSVFVGFAAAHTVTD